MYLYVHVPFCGRRCSYCDFSIAVRSTVPVAQYTDAILAEMVTRRISATGAPLRSIYLGGGTPSKLGGAGVSALIAGIAHRFDVEKFSTSPNEFELTIEANPEDVTPESAAAWVGAGVNRVSLGVQSFDPNVLTWMHRTHGATAPASAVATLRAAGIMEVSVDLIYALPEKLNRSWTEDLDRALELDPDHLSLYGLTVEPQTPLGKWTARGEVAEAAEDRFAEEFLEAHERLAGAGFEHYEVSNYARPGRRARHNSAYWRGVPYIGLGPAAHGFDGERRRWNRAAYTDWLEGVSAGVDPVAGTEIIGPIEREAEGVYLGLRTADGLNIRQNERKTVTSWVEQGWGVLEGERLRLTPQGWLRLDALAAALTSLRSPS